MAGSQGVAIEAARGPALEDSQAIDGFDEEKDPFDEEIFLFDEEIDPFDEAIDCFDEEIFPFDQAIFLFAEAIDGFDQAICRFGEATALTCSSTYAHQNTHVIFSRQHKFGP